jgi:hypothetical protein
MRLLRVILVLWVPGISASALAQAASQPAVTPEIANETYRGERKTALATYFQSLVDADKEYLAALSEAIKFAARSGNQDFARSLDAEQAEVAQTAKEDAAMLAESESPSGGEMIHPEQAVSGGRVVVISAVWGADQKSVDVSMAVRKLIAAGVSAKADNDTLGNDPSPGQTKMLHIKASVDGVIRQYDLWEGTALPGELFVH